MKDKIIGKGCTVSRGEYMGYSWYISELNGSLYIDGALYPFAFKMYCKTYKDSAELVIKRGIERCINTMQIFKIDTKKELFELKDGCRSKKI
jgi:hypothetical protein